MNKSTDTATTSPKSLTPEEMSERKALVKKTMELWSEKKKEMERLRSEGMTEAEVRYETSEM